MSGTRVLILMLPVIVTSACVIPVAPIESENTTLEVAVHDVVSGDSTVVPPEDSGGVLEGRISDGDRGALSWATVSVSGTDLSALTDDKGRFRITGLKGGVHSIVVNRAGYSELTSPVVLTPESGTLSFAATMSKVPLFPPSTDPVERNARMIGGCSFFFLTIVSTPMLVVDGVINMGDDPNTVDPAKVRVKSMEIIQGVGAAAIYGQRAVIGVVEIRTR